MLQALCACHIEGVDGKQILHRDIRPSSILFDKMINAKLTDFGISRIFKHERDAASTMAGTLSYLAPVRNGQIRTNPLDFWGGLKQIDDWVSIWQHFEKYACTRKEYLEAVVGFIWSSKSFPKSLMVQPKCFICVLLNF